MPTRYFLNRIKESVFEAWLLSNVSVFIEFVAENFSTILTAFGGGPSMHQDEVTLHVVLRRSRLRAKSALKIFGAVTFIYELL